MVLPGLSAPRLFTAGLRSPGSDFAFQAVKIIGKGRGVNRKQFPTVIGKGLRCPKMFETVRQGKTEQ